MLFLTIILLTYELLLLINRQLFINPFRKIISNIIKIDQMDKENNEPISKYLAKQNQETLAQNTFLLLITISGIIIILSLLKVVYLILSLSIDIYVYPTLILLFFVIINFIISNKSSMNDIQHCDNLDKIDTIKETLEEKVKLTFKTIFFRLIFITYYVYMLYLIILI